MDTQKILDAALSAASAGVSVVPPRQDGTKAPEGAWRQYQQRRATDAEIRAWYETPRTGLGFVCGAASGGLTAIDFDDRSAYRQFRNLAQQTGLDDLVERVEAGYYEESPNGAHLLVRSARCDGNQKLARNAAGKAVIETRGEGGYLIVAPTFGGVNTAGPYVLKRGGVDSIVTLAPDELEELLRLARLLNQAPPAEADTRQPADDSAGKPGSDYNDRATWGEVLEPHGWREIFSQHGVTHWRRPGKTRGTSATTGYAGTDYLYVFSSNAHPLQPERGYSKFSVYALLNHGGDFAAAAAELALLGYGQDAPVVDDEPVVDLSGILAQGKGRGSDNFPGHLLRVPGVVGDLADWIVRTSPKPQPILALAASIAAVSTVIGRKAQTRSGLRSNLYVLGLGESGCGKERAREAVRTLFAEAGAPQMVGVDSLASSSAIETVMSSHPSSLFLIDELGLFLKAISSPTASGHLQDIKSVLLRLYSASAGVFYGKRHADAKNDVMVEQPCLSIYGTTTPGLFLEHLGATSQAEGFFSRLLVFASEDPDPEYVDIDASDAVSPPESLVAAFRGWLQAPTAWGTDAGNLEAVTRPDPLKVPESSGADRVFADAEAEMRELRQQKRRHGDDPSALVRVVTNARKLALIRACGEVRIDQGQMPEITEQCARWAYELASYLTDRLLSQSDEHAADSDTERVLKAVRRAIKKQGRKGVKKKDIVRSTQRYPKRARDEALTTLLESGEVIARPDKRSQIYIWVGRSGVIG